VRRRLATQAARACRAAALLALAGAPAALAVPSGASRRSFVDDTGSAVSLPAEPARIVSLAPDLTRTLFDLGLGDRIVGVSDACDDPPAAAGRARVGPLVQPSLEAIVALDPDLVLASSEGNPLATVQRLRDVGLPVVGVRPFEPGLPGIAAKVLTVASAAGRPDEGRRLVAAWQRDLAALRAAAAGAPPLSACWLVWAEPPVAAGRGTYLDDLLGLLGVRNACATGAAAWPQLSREGLVLADPDVLVVSTGAHRGARGLPDWTRPLRAVRDGRVVVLPGNAFLRPTLGVATAALVLPRLLRPTTAEADGSSPAHDSRRRAPRLRPASKADGTSP
jgi:iron complex transport system substrate-binding protein